MDKARSLFSRARECWARHARWGKIPVATLVVVWLIVHCCMSLVTLVTLSESALVTLWLAVAFLATVGVCACALAVVVIPRACEAGLQAAQESGDVGMNVWEVAHPVVATVYALLVGATVVARRTADLSSMASKWVAVVFGLTGRRKEDNDPANAHTVVKGNTAASALHNIQDEADKWEATAKSVFPQRLGLIQRRRRISATPSLSSIDEAAAVTETVTETATGNALLDTTNVGSGADCSEGVLGGGAALSDVGSVALVTSSGASEAASEAPLSL